MEPTGTKVHVGVLFGAGSVVKSTKRIALQDVAAKVFLEAQRQVGACQEYAGDQPSFVISLVGQLVSILEDSEYTNAGYGSELTTAGTVECDASMMISNNGKTCFASAGAVPDIKNPIGIPYQLIKMQLDIEKTANRAVPNFIVGTGARDFAEKRLGLCKANLVTNRALNSYTKWMQFCHDHNRTEEYRQEAYKEEGYTDTVGLIVICGDIICVGSSSGGAILKDPGRLGPAAIMGSGFDIVQNCAAVSSGFGEDVNSSRLAARAVVTTALEDVITQGCQRAPSCGVLRATIREKDVSFEWQHSTPSMMCSIGIVHGGQAPDFHIVYSDKPSGGGFKYPK